MLEPTDEATKEIGLDAASGAGAPTTVEMMLLQEHRFLLARRLSGQLSYRAISALIVAFTLLELTPTFGYANLAAVIVAAGVASMWSVEQRLLTERVLDLEKVLARKNRVAFEQIYINYRFETTMAAPRSRSLRLEPVLWFVTILLNTLLSFAFRVLT